MLHTSELTEEDRLEIILQNIKQTIEAEMGINDAKIEGNANAYAINDNKITISQEIIIVLLIILVFFGLWKLTRNYIKKEIVSNRVQNV